MAHLAPVATRSALWSPVIAGLRADALDCLQTGVATLADRWHGPGRHLDLGAPLRFGTDADAAGVPTVEASLEQRLAEAEQLGLRVVARHDGLDGPALRELAEAGGGPLYVVDDAYAMGWLPFAERQHLRHGFLLAAGGGSAVTVVDAYHDDTRWGPARPGVWRLPPARFDDTVRSATAVVLEPGDRPRPDAPAVLAANARALADGRPAIDRYLATADDAGFDRLVLDTWTLSRSRALHAAWLAVSANLTPDALADAEAHARSWRGLATRVFVAAARGGPAAPVVDQLAELLHGDVALAARLAGATVGGPTTPGPAIPAARGPAASEVDGVRVAVVEALAAVLRIPSDATAGVPLRDLPNFNSFRLVDVIERVETRLGVELGPDDLGAASLRDVDSLCAAFARVAGAPAGSLR